MKHAQGLRGLIRLVVCQIGLILLISGLFAGMGWQASYSVLLGGFVCLLPNSLFAWRLFRQTGAQAVRQIMQAFYWGEFTKLGLTILLFGLVFYFIPIYPPAFFIGFIGAQSLIWIAPWLFK